MKSILTLVLFSISFSSVVTNQSFAQETEEVPVPPPVPQPTPEPEPIPQPKPEPIEEPFPGLTDEEKIEKLTEENKKLKEEKAILEKEIDNLEIQQNFLQSQIDALNKKLNDLNAVALEQIKVIMGLVAQLKETVFEKVFLPIMSA